MCITMAKAAVAFTTQGRVVEAAVQASISEQSALRTPHTAQRKHTGNRIEYPALRAAQQITKQVCSALHYDRMTWQGGEVEIAVQTSFEMEPSAHLTTMLVHTYAYMSMGKTRARRPLEGAKRASDGNMGVGGGGGGRGRGRGSGEEQQQQPQQQPGAGVGPLAEAHSEV